MWMPGNSPFTFAYNTCWWCQRGLQTAQDPRVGLAQKSNMWPN